MPQLHDYIVHESYVEYVSIVLNILFKLLKEINQFFVDTTPPSAFRQQSKVPIETEYTFIEDRRFTSLPARLNVNIFVLQ